MLLEAQQLLSPVVLCTHKSSLEHFKTLLAQFIPPFTPPQWGFYQNMVPVFGEFWLLQKIEVA